ncbi:hypothetical protein CSOJ01_12599 [Colletotrichum sojae]|uniref:Uncharacterized protein n=1 Tax=Colletotrichum sojae TaxID=2175907 RepID=A0A8H6IUG5_9PEZI|nr:hypothetical protein CSOJ01_12599 [Colletotrichum sojae]
MLFNLGWVHFGTAVEMALVVSLLLGHVLAVRTAPKAITRNWEVATDCVNTATATSHMFPVLALRHITRTLRDAGWSHRQDQVVSILPDGSRHGWGRVTKTASSKAWVIWAVEGIGHGTAALAPFPSIRLGKAVFHESRRKTPTAPVINGLWTSPTIQNRPASNSRQAPSPISSPLIKRRVKELQLDIRGSKDQGYTRAWRTDPFLIGQLHQGLREDERGNAIAREALAAKSNPSTGIPPEKKKTSGNSEQRSRATMSPCSSPARDACFFPQESPEMREARDRKYNTLRCVAPGELRQRL